MARIRIEFGSGLTLSSSSPSQKCGPPRRTRFCVGPGRGNNDLGLRAGIDSTPDNQSAARKFGAFVHARQAIVSLAPTSVQNLRVDTFPVVPDAHPELPVVIVDANVNSRRAGLLKGVA